MVFEKLERKIKINGVYVTATVEVQVMEDDCMEVSESFDFGDDKANAEYLARFTSGELFNAYVVVQAEALGVTGVDSLGGCHIHSNNMFDSTPFETDVREILRTHGMIQTALDDLAKQVIEQAEKFKPFLQGSV